MHVFRKPEAPILPGLIVLKNLGLACLFFEKFGPVFDRNGLRTRAFTFTESPPVELLLRGVFRIKYVPELCSGLFDLLLLLILLFGDFLRRLGFR